MAIGRRTQHFERPAKTERSTACVAAAPHTLWPSGHGFLEPCRVAARAGLALDVRGNFREHLANVYDAPLEPGSGAS
jgi:hypothetical protein